MPHTPRHNSRIPGDVYATIRAPRNTPLVSAARQQEMLDDLQSPSGPTEMSAPTRREGFMNYLQDLTRGDLTSTADKLGDLLNWGDEYADPTWEQNKADLLDKWFPVSERTETFRTRPSVTDPHPLRTRLENEFGEGGHISRAAGDAVRLASEFIPDRKLDVATLGVSKLAMLPLILGKRGLRMFREARRFDAPFERVPVERRSALQPLEKRVRPDEGGIRRRRQRATQLELDRELREAFPPPPERDVTDLVLPLDPDVARAKALGMPLAEYKSRGLALREQGARHKIDRRQGRSLDEIEDDELDLLDDNLENIAGGSIDADMIDRHPGRSGRIVDDTLEDMRARSGEDFIDLDSSFIDEVPTNRSFGSAKEVVLPANMGEIGQGLARPRTFDKPVIQTSDNADIWDAGIEEVPHPFNTKNSEWGRVTSAKGAHNTRRLVPFSTIPRVSNEARRTQEAVRGTAFSEFLDRIKLRKIQNDSRLGRQEDELTARGISPWEGPDEPESLAVLGGAGADAYQQRLIELLVPAFRAGGREIRTSTRLPGTPAETFAAASNIAAQGGGDLPRQIQRNAAEFGPGVKIDIVGTPEQRRALRIAHADTQAMPGFTKALEQVANFPGAQNFTESQTWDAASELLQIFGPDLKTPVSRILTAHVTPTQRMIASAAGIPIADLSNPRTLAHFEKQIGPDRLDRITDEVLGGVRERRIAEEAIPTQFGTSKTDAPRDRRPVRPTVMARTDAPSTTTRMTADEVTQQELDRISGRTQRADDAADASKTSESVEDSDQLLQEKIEKEYEDAYPFWATGDSHPTEAPRSRMTPEVAEVVGNPQDLFLPFKKLNTYWKNQITKAANAEGKTTQEILERYRSRIPRPRS